MRPRIAIIGDLSSSFLRSMFAGVVDLHRERDLGDFVLAPTTELRSLKVFFREQKPDAVIGQITENNYHRIIADLRIPAVNISNRDVNVPTTRVVSDDVAVGAMAAEHLLDRGFRSFAFTGLDDHHYSNQRKQGFIARLAQKRMECHVAPGPREPEMTTRNYLRWITALPRPLALFCCNDHEARVAMAFVRQHGVVIPDQMAIVGVDNDEINCELSPIPLTSIELNTRKIGYQAATLLRQCLEGRTPAHTITRIAPLGVVVRRSSDTVAVEDEIVSKAIGIFSRSLTDGPRIADVCTEMGISRRCLELHFHKAMGCSPHSQIKRLRLARAQTLLAFTPLSVTQVAQRTGFSQVRSFSTEFKRATGATPSTFRKTAGPQRNTKA